METWPRLVLRCKINKQMAQIKLDAVLHKMIICNFILFWLLHKAHHHITNRLSYVQVHVQVLYV